MPTISKAVAEQTCREAVMTELEISNMANFHRTSNQSYEVLATDGNGVSRVVEVRFVVKTAKENMTAEEALAADVAEYERKKAEALEKLEARRKKAESDKQKRKKKEDEENV